jgi:signal transduction histidine kinase
MKDYQELGVRGPMWLDIRDVIMTAAALLEHTLVQFSFSLQPALIFADPMVRKVFSNIFDNAYRHGGHVTRITVKGYPTGSGYCITVADDGCGIPLEDKEPIFSKGRGKHTGLGLYLCREILSITGISIREKGEPGNGAFFEIQVPSHGYRPLTDATGGTTPPPG